MNVINGHYIMVFNSANENLVNDNNIKAGLSLSGDKGHKVKSYKELLFKLAALNYNNENFQLLFRGQQKDYPISDTNNKSNLFPSILRSKIKRFTSKERKNELIENFKLLRLAEKLLDEEFGKEIWANDRILKWAIIQHYEICPTPLLDVTDSIQTALSFAIGDGDEGYLFVLGFPQLSGAISISIESKTQIIDLSQICPPHALRPHFQNGFVVGDYPKYDDLEKTHGKNAMIGNNFSCRLLTKFHLTNCKKWKKEGFNLTHDEILFPNNHDQFYSKIKNIKVKMKN